MRWAALLRGINLGKRQLKSAELKAVVESMGFTDVKTLLASGNVVFTADEKDAAALEKKLHDALAKETGLKSEIFVRSPQEMAAIVAANPFPEATSERPSFVVVTFHRAPVDKAAVASLAERHDGPERMHAVGRELYIDFPDGQGRSTLHPAMSKAKLDPVNTARNWNTVLKIRDAL
ncbi:DUF1697 domain-containing protein [Sphingomonas sp. BT-65]|uniref:DUF1697 domain-containing protein n=1 Tax=Sphingomonas sp. BT-65 TaxID=2989821 RepID=UPI0022367B24|nr:DUF1697 domain-containing protein [Sphingomonas sp. BT-65]MCW4462359.1 DUF1697 domain-containing protein [Sphingomonas sp. BT-65]